MKWIPALFVVCSFALPASAKEPVHALDKKVADCMADDAGQSTVGMGRCLDQSYKDWDAELNRVYKEIRKRASESQGEKLKASQRLWIQYRDAEFDHILALYGSREGTMWGLMVQEARTRVVSHRVKELSAFLDLLETED